MSASASRLGHDLDWVTIKIGKPSRWGNPHVGETLALGKPLRWGNPLDWVTILIGSSSIVIQPCIRTPPGTQSQVPSIHRTYFPRASQRVCRGPLHALEATSKLYPDELPSPGASPIPSIFIPVTQPDRDQQPSNKELLPSASSGYKSRGPLNA